MNENVLEITDDQFYGVISQNDIVLVDFWAPWCGPCIKLSPVIEELANLYKGKAVICKLNIDNNMVAHAQYGIKTIPTMIVFHEGLEVERLVGYCSMDEIQKTISRYLH
jgi:thioredoxin 1